MLKITITPNGTGIDIRGDYEDLYELNESIYDLIGNEHTYEGYEGVRLNCLGLAYDLRHAYMGTRKIEEVDNGVHREMKKWHGRLLPEQNIYFSVEVIWTEAMFVVLVLNDLIQLASNPKSYKKLLEGLPEEVVDEQKKRIDYAIAVVKLFQTLVWQQFRNMVGENRYKRIYNKSINPYMYITNLQYEGFCTQYIEELTCDYLGTNKDKRPVKLAKCIMNMIEKPTAYIEMKRDIRDYARECNVHVSEVRIQGIEYPEEIIW